MSKVMVVWREFSDLPTLEMEGVKGVIPPSLGMDVWTFTKPDETLYANKDVVRMVVVKND